MSLAQFMTKLGIVVGNTAPEGGRRTDHEYFHCKGSIPPLRRSGKDKRFISHLFQTVIFAVLALVWHPAFTEAQVYVANSGSGTVSVLSTPDHTLLAEIPVGALPSRIAVTPDGAFVYVTNENSGTMSKISAASNSVVAPISVGSLPKGVAVSADGSSVFVIAAGTLRQYSVATNAFVRAYSLPTGVPVDVAISPDGAFAYVVDKNQNRCSLYPINLTTGAVMTSTDCTATTGAVGGSFPRAVAVRPDGQFVYVTAFQDGALQVVRASDYSYAGGGCIISGCPLAGGGPIGVAVSQDGRFDFTANSNDKAVSIFALDQVSGLPAVPIRVPLPTKPWYLDVTPDGTRLYVSHGSNSVSVIDLTTNPPTLIDTLTVGNGPLGVAVSPLASGGGGGSQTLSVAPASLAFTGEQGLGDPAPQTVQVGASGMTALSWTLAATGQDSGAGSWLKADLLAGTAPPTGSVQISAGTCGLAAGTYLGTISVASGQASNSPQSIPVSLTVATPSGPLAVPSVRVCVDRQTYQPGQTLEIRVSLRQGVSSNSGDAYLFTSIPGDVNFVSLVWSEQGIGVNYGPAPVPFGTNFQVADFSGLIFERVFDASDPQGTYELQAILAVAGSDPTLEANRLAAATINFSVTP
jgi:YVTN family beta-propeller protein